MIDEEEIKKICTKDLKQGIKMLMNCYQESLYNHIRRLLVSHEDTQDALQETFVRVFRSWNTFRGDSSLSTWIYRIATNESLRILNSKKSKANISAEELQNVLIGKLKTAEYIDYDDVMTVKFQEAILSLPEKQRLVFNLRYYDDLSYDEIAEILDSKVETLKVNYHYAKEKIKNYIINN